MSTSAMKLLFSLSELDEMFLNEAEEFAPQVSNRKRIAKYSALATAAAVGLAVTVKFIRIKRAA